MHFKRIPGYRISFGDLAIITNNAMVKVHALSILYRYMQEESLLMVAGASVVAILAAFTIGKQRLRDICFSLPVIYLLLLAPFSVWEVLNTVQTASRKLSIAFPALILVLLLIGLQRSKGWLLRVTVITGLLLLQFGFALSVVYPRLISFKSHAYMMGRYVTPVSLRPNPHDEISHFLRREFNQYHYTDVSAMVNGERAMPIDPFLLAIMNRMDNEPYTFGYPYVNFYSDDNLRQTLNHVGRAVFLSDKKEDMVITEMAAKAYYKRFEDEPNPILKMLYRFLYFYSLDKLDSIGWKRGPCMVVKANDGKDYQGCLLLVTVPSSRGLSAGPSVVN